MGVLTLAVAHPLSAACIAPPRCTSRKKTEPIAGGLCLASLFSSTLKKQTPGRKLQSRSVVTRAHVGPNANTPASSRRESSPADRAGWNEKEEDRESAQTDEQRLIAVGEGDDPEAVGAISICLDAIGTVSCTIVCRLVCLLLLVHWSFVKVNV